MAEKPSSPFAHLIAGVTGGAVSVIFVHPLDLVKTRYQAQVHKELASVAVNSGTAASTYYRNTFHAFSSIAKTEGIPGLYQGLLPNVIGASLSWGLFFLGYSFLKDKLKKIRETQVLSASDNLLAGAGAGVFIVVTTNPIWVLKTRMQLQLVGQAQNYRGLIDGFRTIYSQEGIKGFYKGFLPALVGASHGALQFMAYEEIRKLQKLLDLEGNHFYDSLLPGGASKIFAVVATYPYQVVKTRLQERPIDGIPKYNGIMDIIRKIWSVQGFQGFYRGIGPNLLRVTPASAITIAVYEEVMKSLKSFGI